MKHDYEKAKRGSVIQSTGKTRVTMYLDDDVIEHFRKVATNKGRGYQTEINSCLRQAMNRSEERVLSRQGTHGGLHQVVVMDLSVSEALRSLEKNERTKLPDAFVCKSLTSRRRYLEQA